MADELVRLKFEVDLGVDHYYHNLDISKHDPDEELVDFGVKRPKIEIIEVEDREEENDYIWPPVSKAQDDGILEGSRKNAKLEQSLVEQSLFLHDGTQAHERIKNPQENPCPLCRAIFPSKNELSHHILIKHPDPLQITDTCPGEMPFNSRDVDAPFIPHPIRRLPLANPNRSRAKAIERFFCHYCKFHREYRFNSEMRAHIVYHKNQLTTKSIPCEKCVVVSGSELLYRFHRLSHSNFWLELNNSQINQLEKQICFSDDIFIKCPLPTCKNLAPFTSLEDFEAHGHSISNAINGVNPNHSKVKHALPPGVSVEFSGTPTSSRRVVSKTQSVVADPFPTTRRHSLKSLNKNKKKAQTNKVTNKNRSIVGNFFCHYCKHNRNFRYNSEMRAHIVSHKKVLEPIPCDKCVVVCGSELLYRFHRLSHSNFWLELNNSQINQLEKQICFSDEICIKCPLSTCNCLAPFRTLNEFEDHVCSILHAGLEFQNNQDTPILGTELKLENDDDIVFLGVVGKDCDNGIFPDL